MKTLPPRVSDWWFVGIDETQHWNIPEHQQHVAKIHTVYMFDRAQLTHCCELTPSYWLLCVDFNVDHVPGFFLRPDADTLREELDDVLRQVPKEESNCYMHARHVEALLTHETTPRYHFGPAPEEAETEEQVIDSLFESWHRNPKF